MAVKFEIDFVLSDKRKDNYVIARLMDPDQNFNVQENSFLNQVPIKSGIISPRALDETGAPRYDLFIFYPVNPEDIKFFEKWMIVELTT
jgi:hypothetical protein